MRACPQCAYVTAYVCASLPGRPRPEAVLDWYLFVPVAEHLPYRAVTSSPVPPYGAHYIRRHAFRSKSAHICGAAPTEEGYHLLWCCCCAGVESVRAIAFNPRCPSRDTAWCEGRMILLYCWRAPAANGGGGARFLCACRVCVWGGGGYRRFVVAACSSAKSRGGCVNTASCH